ncbi:MAG TPA: hypothetical protein VM164_03590 [Burkholderiales bacterium]|nr:hypothetical protein [Burkholderiales bacterium]
MLQKKKAGSMSRLFGVAPPSYFLSVFDSLGELGIGVVGAIGEVLLELDAPVPVVLELVVPVPVVLVPVVVSALGASAGAGVGVGAATGGVGAGAGGGVTTFSSFLQAMRPTARMAARRSERFIFFPLGTSHGLTKCSNNRGMPALPHIRSSY